MTSFHVKCMQKGWMEVNTHWKYCRNNVDGKANPVLTLSLSLSHTTIPFEWTAMYWGTLIFIDVDLIKYSYQCVQAKTSTRTAISHLCQAFHSSSNNQQEYIIQTVINRLQSIISIFAINSNTKHIASHCDWMMTVSSWNIQQTTLFTIGVEWQLNNKCWHFIFKLRVFKRNYMKLVSDLQRYTSLHMSSYLIFQWCILYSLC